MDIKKTINNYTKIYRKALIKAKISDIDAEIAAYEKRLEEMYTSDNFKRHSKYLSTNAVHVYAVIAMCLGLRKFNLSDSQMIDTINSGFEKRRNFFRSLCKIFCMTDTTSYENLPKHVQFIRHSDLSDGSCCHDEVIDKRRIRD